MVLQEINELTKLWILEEIDTRATEITQLERILKEIATCNEWKRDKSKRKADPTDIDTDHIIKHARRPAQEHQHEPSNRHESAQEKKYRHAAANVPELQKLGMCICIF